MSRFGGVPIEEATPAAGRFGGAPVEQAGQQALTSKQPVDSVAGSVGAVNRGLAPYAAGAAIGAAAGAPFAGVGAIPGAVAGTGAVALTQLVGDPVVGLVNSLLGTEYQMPTDAMNELLTRLGVPEPKTETERILTAISGAATGAGGTAAAAKTLAAGARSPVVKGALDTMAAQPVQQAVSGAAAGGASQATAEAGGGQGAQLAAGLAGGLVGARFAPGQVRSSVQIPLRPDDVPPLLARREPEFSSVSSPEAALPAAQQAEFGKLVAKASSKIPTPGVGAAKKELAESANVSADAVKSAQTLGVDLPADVIADNRLLSEAAGQLRGLKSTEASVQWAEKKSQVMDRARTVLEEMGASPDVSTLSARVQYNIRATRDDLQKSARELYDQVDAAVPKDTVVDTKNLQAHLSDVLKNNPNSMTAAEKKLMELATRGDITYSDLTSIKSDIGAAQRGIQKGLESYTSIPDHRLKMLNNALGEDKLAAVGDDLSPLLKQADRFTAMQKDMESKVINAFGKEGDGSIASSIDSAIKSGSAKGDVKQLNGLLNVIPKDMHKEALLSGIYRNARSNDHFSFKKFSNLYAGLRENKEVYSSIAKTLSEDEQEMLRALYVVSKRMARAEDQVSKTGASLQSPLMNAINAQSLVGKIVSSTGGKLAATAIGAKVGGVFGGTAAAGAANKMAQASKDAGARRASALLTSPEFDKLVLDTAKNGRDVSQNAVRAVAASPEFIAFAKSNGVPLKMKDRERWIMQAIVSGSNAKTTEEEE